MLFRALHRVGIPSYVFYLASLGSIGASVIAWAVRNEKNVANAERLGIFIGLWAPTFMLLGHGLQELETKKGMGLPELEGAAGATESAVDDTRGRMEAAGRS